MAQSIQRESPVPKVHRSRAVPSVFELGAYKFVFFSSDREEPVHIHVKRDRQIAKFWLAPVSLATTGAPRSLPHKS